MKRILFTSVAVAALLLCYPAARADVCSSVTVEPRDQFSVNSICNQANNPPVAVDDTGSGVSGTTLSGNVLTNDTDQDVGQTLVVEQPNAGGIAADGSYAISQPTPGVLSIPYTVMDGLGGTDDGTLVLTFTNQNPVANPDVASGQTNSAITGNVLTNDSDPDGGTLSVEQPNANIDASGNFSFSSSTTGTFTLVYTLLDGQGGSASSSLAVTVNAPPNQSPVAVDDNASGPTGTALAGNVLTNDSDADGGTLSVVQPNSNIAANGSYSINRATPGLVIAPYTVSDGQGGTDGGTLTLNFTNRNPVAANDTASGNTNAAISGNVLANDSDPDGGTLSVTPTGPIGANGAFSFTSASPGTFTFPYDISDGQGGSAGASLTITVTAPPPTGWAAFANPINGNVPFARTTVVHADENRKLAFPSAQGHGKFADPDIGPGQTFTIYKVTNLNDSGAGSFRNCWMATTGPRVCIFTVSGTINITTDMLAKGPQNNVYVAGQTSPGGIQFKVTGTGFGPWRTQSVSDLIVRFIKSRPGTGSSGSSDMDAFTFSGETPGHDIMLDHLTAQWGADETIDFSNNERATLQWTMLSEPLACGPCRSDGQTDHDYGILTKGKSSNMTLHHNLIMSAKLRSPNAAAEGYDFINNVVYNYGNYAGQLFVTNNKNMIANFVGNWYSRGPRAGNMTETNAKPHAFYVSRDPQTPPANLGHELYFNNNITAHDLTGTNPNASVYLNNPLWRPNQVAGSVVFTTPRNGGLSMTASSPTQAWKDVYAFAGARQDMFNETPRKDAVEQRSLDQLANCTNHSYTPSPDIISAPPSPGYPDLTLGTTWSWGADSDNDGMMDSWELLYAPNLTTLAANGDNDSDGWSNLEEFLNFHAGDGIDRIGTGTATVPTSNCGWGSQ